MTSFRRTRQQQQATKTPSVTLTLYPVRRVNSKLSILSPNPTTRPTRQQVTLCGEWRLPAKAIVNSCRQWPGGPPASKYGPCTLHSSQCLTAVPHHPDSLAAGGSGGSIIPKSIDLLLIRIYSYLNGTAKLHAAIRVALQTTFLYASSLL